MTKQRIWELDALRGVCILGMLVFHTLYDITALFRLVSWQIPGWLTLIADAGARVFLLLSGLCVTLGSRPVRRGLSVFGCGMLCTLVTWAMYMLGLSGQGIIIRFGMLHCLGLCMLLWPLMRRLPAWALAAAGILIIACGWYLDICGLRVESHWLFPLGLRYYGFSSGDYYPLLPCLGWFLLGAVLGRALYRRQTTLLPRIDPHKQPLAFLQLCGRYSLPIYLLHQPILSGILSLLTLPKQ